MHRLWVSQASPPPVSSTGTLTYTAASSEGGNGGQWPVMDGEPAPAPPAPTRTWEMGSGRGTVGVSETQRSGGLGWGLGFPRAAPRGRGEADLWPQREAISIPENLGRPRSSQPATSRPRLDSHVGDQPSVGPYYVP